MTIQWKKLVKKIPFRKKLKYCLKQINLFSSQKLYNISSEAEKSRLRSVCGSQILKLAQEPCFKQLITAEYFHLLAKLLLVKKPKTKFEKLKF